MKAEKIERILLEESPEQTAENDEIRRQVMEEFPPRAHTPAPAVGFGIDIRRAREAKGMTWYAVAKAAGIPDSRTVRDIELGHDVKLSSLEAVATALGLRLKIVAA